MTVVSIEHSTYLYRGLKKNDSTYNQGSVPATTAFFRAFLPSDSIHFESSVQSEHLVPGVNPYLCWWEEWAGPDNCTYDGAYHALSWIHGAWRAVIETILDTAALWAAHGHAFDQRPFSVPDGHDAGLAESGAVFVPRECDLRASPTPRCVVHMFLHGCDVTDTFDVFAQWAMANRFVVVYPRMSTRGTYAQQHPGCWDGYGQTGEDYDEKTGPQMAALARIAAHFAGLPDPAA